MSRASELMNIRSALRRFNVADYRKHVVPCFPEELQKIAKGKVKNVTKKVMVDQLMNVIKTERRASLEGIHMRLCTVSVSLYSEKRNWHAYEMKNTLGRDVNIQRLPDKLLQACRIENFNSDIEIVKRNGILWFTFVEKNIIRNRGIVRGRPIFYAYILDTPYLLCTTNTLHTKIEKAFLRVFSSTSIIDLTLVGRDIKSLHTTLLRKEGGVASLRVPSYKAQKYKTFYGCKDYTQHENRKEFAEKCFPVDAKIETLTLTNGNDVWNGDLDGEDLKLRWAVKLVSPNIFLALKDFTENNVIEPEHAIAYALRLGKEGKTKIQVPIIP